MGRNDHLHLDGEATPPVALPENPPWHLPKSEGLEQLQRSLVVPRHGRKYVANSPFPKPLEGSVDEGSCHAPLPMRRTDGNEVDVSNRRYATEDPPLEEAQGAFALLLGDEKGPRSPYTSDRKERVDAVEGRSRDSFDFRSVGRSRDTNPHAPVQSPVPQEASRASVNLYPQTRDTPEILHVAGDDDIRSMRQGDSRREEV